MTKVETIHYSIHKSTIGYVLLAQSTQGLCALLLGDTEAIVFDDLRRRFPGVTLKESDSDHEKLSASVLKFINNPTSPLDLPLDIRGTTYQRQVWTALQKIPVGKTASYKEIANQINKPNASRAIAQACAANPLAVIIPCHRVVKSDGTLSGYRWGIERKQQLLQMESML